MQADEAECRLSVLPVNPARPRRMRSLHVDVAERRIAIVPGVLRGSELGDAICRRTGAGGLRLRMAAGRACGCGSAARQRNRAAVYVIAQFGRGGAVSIGVRGSLSTDPVENPVDKGSLRSFRGQKA